MFHSLVVKLGCYLCRCLHKKVACAVFGHATYWRLNQAGGGGTRERRQCASWGAQRQLQWLHTCACVCVLLVEHSHLLSLDMTCKVLWKLLDGVISARCSGYNLPILQLIAVQQEHQNACICELASMMGQLPQSGTASIAEEASLHTSTAVWETPDVADRFNCCCC